MSFCDASASLPLVSVEKFAIQYNMIAVRFFLVAYEYLSQTSFFFAKQSSENSYEIATLTPKLQ
jgi:hypothetical protein